MKRQSAYLHLLRDRQCNGTSGRCIQLRSDQAEPVAALCEAEPSFYFDPVYSIRVFPLLVNRQILPRSSERRSGDLDPMYPAEYQVLAIPVDLIEIQHDNPPQNHP